VLATIALFSAVGHWNSWFDGVLYINEIKRWPLQSYLYARVTSKMITKSGVAAGGQAERMGVIFNELTPEGLSTAMILVATIPIMLIYPFLQRYFVTGLTLGAVKG
jgi:putative aldouronate transport system permease protein